MRTQYHKPPLPLSFESCYTVFFCLFVCLFVSNRERGTTSPGAERVFFVVVVVVVVFSVHEYHEVLSDRNAQYATHKN